MMSLRSLGSLLTRRLLSRASGISRAQANKALAGTLSPHTRVGDGAGAGAGTYGGVAAAALAGLVGILCFMKDAHELAGKVMATKETAGEEAKKQLAGQEDKQGAITVAETKEHNDDDDDFSLEEYLAEMTKLAAAHKKARDERSCKNAVKEAITNIGAIKDDDEEAMKARFEEWIKEYGKRYRSKEEKARRYELFKAFANMVDRATAQGGAVFVTNHTADWTEEECQCLYDTDVDWDDYLDHIRSLIDKRNAKAKNEV